MKILLIGGSGQLGSTLIKTKPRDITLIFPKKSDFNLININQCLKFIDKENPDLIINAGAYTNVEQAEEDIEKTFKINYLATEAIAKKIKSSGSKLIQISTDYVFDGYKKEPYKANDKKNPKNIYGESKSLGENAIINYLTEEQYIILRTSWVLSPFRNNFLLKILNLIKNRKTINVVNDQFGSMTSTYSIAKLIWIIVYSKNSFKSNFFSPNILHWCDKGITSWYEIAYLAKEIGMNNGLIENGAEIVPISTCDLNLKAERPKFSALDCCETLNFYQINQTYWKDSLNKIMQNILNEKNFL